jgi:copper resistance protein B
MRRSIVMLLLATAAPAFGQTIDHGAHAAPGVELPAAQDSRPGDGDQPAPASQSSEAAMSAPGPPRDWAADALYPAGEMAAARTAMLAEHGDMTFAQVMVNIAEIGVRGGRDSYRWDGEGWFGGDIDRLTVKSEGHGRFGRPIDEAEVQALWSHAVDAYWNVQAGVRQDLGQGPATRHLTAGIEGLAPYWFEVEAALFLSDKGHLQGRVEAFYDQRLSQSLILQPRIEINLAAQDIRSSETGSGLSDAELGLRLRYEIRREFAPYIGISHERRFGDGARFARAAGEGAHATSVVAGIRFWF